MSLSLLLATLECRGSPLGQSALGATMLVLRKNESLICIISCRRADMDRGLDDF